MAKDYPLYRFIDFDGLVKRPSIPNSRMAGLLHEFTWTF